MTELTKITDYGAYKQALTDELQSSAEGFIRIGYLLRMAVETDVLSGSGYGNVYDFASAEYGLDKSQVSRFININKKFSEGGYSDRLLPQFEGYGSSKLAVMLQIPDEIIENLSPDYTKAELTAIKDEVKAELSPDAPSDIEVMSEPVIPECEKMELWQKAVYEYVKTDPNLYMRLYIAAHSKIPGALFDEIAPLGEIILFARVTGIGKVSISINPAVVSVFAVRSGEESKESWEDVEKFILYMAGDSEDDPPACVKWSTVFHIPFPIEEREEEKKPSRVEPERKPEKAEQKPQKTASNSTKPKETAKNSKEPQKPIMPEPEIMEPEDIEEIRPEVAPEQMDISDVMPAEDLPEDYVPDKNIIPYNRTPGLWNEIKERVRYMGGRLAEGSATAAEIRAQADIIIKICDEIEGEE